MSRIVITGATGTIGRAVSRALAERGDQVVALSRDPRRAQAVLGEEVETHEWRNALGQPPPTEPLSGADGIIHLLGEPISQRWTDSAKAAIRDSRVRSTEMLVSALRELPEDRRPQTLVSQSATGIYGASDDRELDEDAPAGGDFLATVVQEWEAAARAAEGLVRVTMTRTGVVLSPSGGALSQMLPFFRLGVGGPVAGGRQFVSWIHLDDEVAGILFCLDHEVQGPLNLTAPHPVTNAEFSRALGRALHRPAVLPVPSLALRLLYGEMAQIVTTGQRVLPKRMLDHGFEFRHTLVDPAVADLLAGSG